MNDPSTPLASSRFVWIDAGSPGRNQFVSFFRTFAWRAGNSATLHVFADTRFRLFVNGHFLAYALGRERLSSLAA